MAVYKHIDGRIGKKMPQMSTTLPTLSKKLLKSIGSAKIKIELPSKINTHSKNTWKAEKSQKSTEMPRKSLKRNLKVIVVCAENRAMKKDCFEKEENKDCRSKN